MYGARSACNVILVDSNSLPLLVARHNSHRRPLDYYGPLMINGCMWEHASMIILALCESHSEGNRKPVPNTTTKTAMAHTMYNFPQFHMAGHGLLSFHMTLFLKNGQTVSVGQLIFHSQYVHINVLDMLMAY